MSFLKKLGSIILKGVEIVSGISPILETSLPGQADKITTISNDLSQIAGVIVSIEAFGQALNTPGAQKLIAAAPQVAQIILQSSILVGRKIENPTLFNQGVSEIAAGMADILNSLKDDIDTSSKT